MDTTQMAVAFNEWMRRFIDDPAGFEAEFRTVGDFLAEQNDGKEPTYGERSAIYMQKLLAELSPVS